MSAPKPTAPEAKRKFPRADAIATARIIVKEIEHDCVRLVVAGSLRRRKAFVGDVELLYIPKTMQVRNGLFDVLVTPMVDITLERLVAGGQLAARKTVTGSISWGAKNKLAVHLPCGIPVDFFATSEESWSNYLVCRTGSAESNRRIAMAAQRKGWKWNPYGAGFTDAFGDAVPASSEREVFDLVGLPYQEPWERV